MQLYGEGGVLHRPPHQEGPQAAAVRRLVAQRLHQLQQVLAQLVGVVRLQRAGWLDREDVGLSCQ